MESNDEEPLFKKLSKEELLALSDEDRIKYLKEKRGFDLHKAHEALKKSMYALREVNKKMMEEMKS